ncbi:MAG: FMN-binding protein [Dethiobacteria bacterium]
MNNIIKMTVILALVGALSGLLLTGANMLTAPVLEQNTLQQKMELLQDFFPAAEETSSEEIEGISFDIVYNQKGEFLGVMALAHTAGYGGTIKYYLAIGSDGQIKGIHILEHSESPGIGDVIADPDFLKELIGKNISESFVIGEDIDTVTGATISTTAYLLSVSDIVNAASDLYKGIDLMKQP